MRPGRFICPAAMSLSPSLMRSARRGFITGRVAQCVPYGHFLGSRWPRPVMTKAGGFGTETTLRDVVNFIEEKLSV